MNNILFACGGTGGHIYPAVALAENMIDLAPQVKVFFGGRKEGMEKDLLQDRFTYIGIEAFPLKRGKMSENLSLPYNFFKSILMAKKEITKNEIECVVATGGYVTLPYLVAAWFLKIPCYLQEQNVYAGIANKIAGKWAKAVFVPDEDCKPFFKNTECIVSGNPVRKAPDQKLDKPELYQGFDKVVLVLGGSQGAKGVNKKIDEWLPHKNEKCLVCWQTGKPEYEKFSDKYKDRTDVKLLSFIDGIYAYMKHADVVVSRAGASTIAELNLIGKGAIFIPFPYATENHQEKNARSLQNHGAALVELEHENSFDTLIDQLLESDTMRNSLDKSSAALAKPNAAYEIVMTILAKEGI